MAAASVEDKPVKLALALPDVAGAQTLIDTDWQRYGGQTPDAPHETQACKKGQLTVSLPACTGRLMKLEATAD